METHASGGGAASGTAQSADSQQYLSFALGAEAYAVNISSIKEIIEYGGLRPIPMVASFIRGVINLRGSVVPIIDLAARFGRRRSAITRRTTIVIAEVMGAGATQDVGFMVDGVNSILQIPADLIEQAPAFGAKIRSDFIQGMGCVDDRFVIILDLATVLAIEELSAARNNAPGTSPPS
jgi:purine-binding chemotaxis protein CheW